MEAPLLCGKLLCLLPPSPEQVAAEFKGLVSYKNGMKCAIATQVRKPPGPSGSTSGVAWSGDWACGWRMVC